MSEVVKKWYVIRAISGKENKVKELLELEINRHNLQSYVDQVLIPTEKIYQIRKGKKISKEKNYFPGYRTGRLFMSVGMLPGWPKMWILLCGRSPNPKVLCLRMMPMSG